MQILVELFLHLKAFAPTPTDLGPAPIEVPDGATARDVLGLLGVPETAEKVVLVDGLLRDPGEGLRAGETLTVFPPLNGG